VIWGYAEPRAIALRGRDKQLRGLAIVDTADWERLGNRRWCDSKGYVVTSTTVAPYKTELRYLHREILGLDPKSKVITDHINRDRSDNRRSNLRPATQALNAQNKPSLGGSSQYRGVSFNKEKRRWEARHEVNGERTFLGYFAHEQDAAQAAQDWRRRHMPYATN
jgi:hypothetical protein